MRFTVTHQKDLLVLFRECVLQDGLISGYQINKGQTKLLIWNLAEEGKPYLFLEFNFTAKWEKYLGICMTKINQDLCKNYLPTWKKVTTNWVKLSWLGKTTTVKISILLR